MRHYGPFRIVCSVVLTLLSGSGCVLAPDRVTWHPDQKVIGPGGPSGESKGLLVVETVYLGNDNGIDRRQSFSVYDDRGKYLTHDHNDWMDGIHLPAGRYVVVTALQLTNRQVQVEVREGCTTRVTLNDFKSAPEAE